MQKLSGPFVRAIGALLFGLMAAGNARAADIAIVDVPEGMILETQLVRASDLSAPTGTPVGFVVTHDLRVGDDVVIAAGSQGVGHLARAARSGHRASVARVAYDYVLANDGTRIPVAGSSPYLTTRASRSVVIYDSQGDDRPSYPSPPVSPLTGAPVARP